MLGVVPQDEQVFEFDCDGVPTVKLPENSPVRKAHRTDTAADALLTELTVGGLVLHTKLPGIGAHLRSCFQQSGCCGFKFFHPECGLKPNTVGLIVNRAPGGVLNEGTKEEIEKQGLTLLGVVPQDEQVFEFDCDGVPT